MALWFRRTSTNVRNHTISIRFNCHHTTMYCLPHNFVLTRTSVDRRQPDRQRETTTAQDRNNWVNQMGNCISAAIRTAAMVHIRNRATAFENSSYGPHIRNRATAFENSSHGPYQKPCDGVWEQQLWSISETVRRRLRTAAMVHIRNRTTAFENSSYGPHIRNRATAFENSSYGPYQKPCDGVWEQ